ncbi:MAG TPA: hypothetical protein VNA13_04370 [Xanthomonadales bacterium]|nr:hypothetical protein [Xanthomonadales bacterium]
MKWINRLYIIFLGIILSITTGFGVAAFYPQPVSPSYAASSVSHSIVTESCYKTPEDQASSECQKAFEKQEEQSKKDDEAFKAYANENAGYTRTAIFFGIVVGSLFAILGIGIIKKSKLVANGLLFGAVLTAVLTRLLINLASLGASTTGTNNADTLAYVEFGVLLILSVAIIMVGLNSLKDENITTK